MAPRGPRASASRGDRGATLGAKTTTRGGVQKRRSGATKTDLDGDLDMDATGKRVARNTGSDSKGAKPKPSRAAPGQPARGASRAAQTVLKHLKGNDASSLASRVSAAASGRSIRPRGKGAALRFLRIHGLKQSKAVNNPDGGLGDLLAFLERKATSFTGRPVRQVIIKKVCRSSTQYSERHRINQRSSWLRTGGVRVNNILRNRISGEDSCSFRSQSQTSI